MSVCKWRNDTAKNYSQDEEERNVERVKRLFADKQSCQEKVNSEY